MTFLEGETRIGADASIGPSTRIVDSTVGDRSEVTFAVVLGSTIGQDVRVGPFVRMRPGTVLEDGSKAGAFVDIKNATVGKGSKVPHLSYVGDADIGTDVNVGAGTVTVNFDGYEKHRTVDRRWGEHRLRYDVGRTGHDREGREHGGGLGDHEGRAGGRARRGTRRAAQRRGVPQAQGRGAPATGRRARGSAVEIITKKRMMLFTGTIHPDLGARDRRLPRDPGERIGDPPVREHASSTSARRRACAAPTASSSRRTTSP